MPFLLLDALQLLADLVVARALRTSFLAPSSAVVFLPRRFSSRLACPSSLPIPARSSTSLVAHFLGRLAAAAAAGRASSLSSSPLARLPLRAARLLHRAQPGWRRRRCLHIAHASSPWLLHHGLLPASRFCHSLASLLNPMQLLLAASPCGQPSCFHPSLAGQLLHPSFLLASSSSSSSSCSLVLAPTLLCSCSSGLPDTPVSCFLLLLTAFRPQAHHPGTHPTHLLPPNHGWLATGPNHQHGGLCPPAPARAWLLDSSLTLLWALILLLASFLCSPPSRLLGFQPEGQAGRAWLTLSCPSPLAHTARSAHAHGEPKLPDIISSPSVHLLLTPSSPPVSRQGSARSESRAALVAGVCGSGISGLPRRAWPHGDGFDPNADKVELINAGHAPVVEAELAEDCTRRAVAQKRLHATTDPVSAVLETDITFICVATPSLPNGSLDLNTLLENRRRDRPRAAHQARLSHGRGALDDPAGRDGEPRLFRCCANIRAASEPGKDFGLGYYPEFLRESSAIDGFPQSASRVIGAMRLRAPPTRWRSLNADLTAPPVSWSIAAAAAIGEIRRQQSGTPQGQLRQRDRHDLQGARASTATR